MELWSHLGWKGAVKIMQFKTHCHCQRHLLLDQVFQSPSQHTLEHLSM